MFATLAKAATSWIALVVLWLMLAGTFSAEELVAAVIAATLGLGFGIVLVRREVLQATIRLAWLRSLFPLPGRLLRDTWMVFFALTRHLVGRQSLNGSFHELPFEANDSGALDVGRRALATAVLSFTPNTFVIGIDRERGRMVVHQLVPRPISELRRQAEL
jgi:multisubunit Na+/H+ antiporter MnhE subunit